MFSGFVSELGATFSEISRRITNRQIGPDVCKLVVLRHTEPLQIASRQIDLRPEVPLLGCQSDPADRFSVVLRHTVTILVGVPENKLCLGVSLLGCKSEPAERFSSILPNTETIPQCDREL